MNESSIPLAEVVPAASQVRVSNQVGPSASLTQEQMARLAKAKRKGRCVHCSIPTHRRRLGGLGQLVPLTNRDIWNGICRQCNPNQVPREHPNNNNSTTTTSPAHPVSNSPSTTRQSTATTESRSDSTATNMTTAYGLRSSSQESEAFVRLCSINTGMAGSAHSLWNLDEFPESSSSLSWQISGVTNDDSSEHDLSRSTEPGTRSAEFLVDREMLMSISENRGELGVPLSPNASATNLSQHSSIEFSPGQQRRLAHEATELVSLLLQLSLSASGGGECDTNLLDCIWAKLKSGLDMAQVAETMEDLLENNPDLDEAASQLVCGILWKVAALSDEPAVRSLDSYSRCFDFVLNALRRHRKHPATVECAMGTLAAILTNAGYSGMLRLVETGGIELIVANLHMHKQHARILGWTARCILLLLDAGQQATNDPAKLRMAEKVITIVEQVQATKILINSMKASNDTSAQFWSLQAIWRLWSADAYTALSSLDDDSFGDYLRALLGRRDLSSRTVLLAAVDLLCGVLDSAPTRSKAFSTPERTVALAFSLMETWKADESVLAACCRIFYSLARGDATTRLVLRETKVLQGMINAYQLYPTSLETAEILFGTLWRISTVDAGFFSIGQVRQLLKATEAVVLEHCLSSRALLCSACGFIGSMALTDDLTCTDIPINVIVHALHLYGDDSSVYNEASDALAQVTEKFPELQTFAVDSAIEYLKQSHTACSTKHIVGLLQALPDKNREHYCARIVPILLKQTKVKKGHEMSCAINEEIFAIVLLQPALALDSEDALIAGACELVSCIGTPLETIREACVYLWGLAYHRPRLAEHRLSLMQKAVVELLRRLSDANSLDEDLAMVASGTLSCINRRLSPSLSNAPNAITILLACLNTLHSCGAATVDALERFLETLASLFAIDGDSFTRSDAVNTILDIMATYERHEGIQERGCVLLAHFASSESLHVIFNITENDGVDVLLSCLGSFTENNGIQLNACAALRHLCCEEESKTLVIEQGGLHMLCSLLSADPKDSRLLQTALAALERLISAQVLDASMLGKMEIVDPLLATMLAIPDERALQTACLSLMLQLFVKAPHLRAEVIAHGGLHVLISAASTFVGCSDVVNKVLEALATLHTGDASCQIQLSIQSMQVIVDGFAALIENEESQRCGCSCLAIMAERKELRAIIRQAKGTDAIARAACAHSTSEYLAILACRGLSNLARPEEQALDIEISAVLLLMTHFNRSPMVQQLGCSILRNYLPSQSNALVMKTAPLPVMSVVVNASTAFPDHCSNFAGVILSLLDS